MIRITTGDMMHVHGGFAQKVDYTVRFSVRLKDAVDAELLSGALKKTQERYPYFCVRLRKGEASFYYEENPLPVVLLHRNGRISLNTDEVNGHVWAVCYYEDYIHLDFYHGITDGTGMYKVLSTLLYYYCAERYGAARDKGICTVTDEIMPEETQDPQDTLPDIDLSTITAGPGTPAFTLETDGELTPSKATIWDVAIPQDAFMRLVEDYDSTPGTMITILFARAIRSLYQDKECAADAEGSTVSARGKDIISVYVINARPMLGAKNILHNCLGMAFFDYEDRIAKRSEELVLKYSPRWTGAGETRHPISIPDAAFRYFEPSDHEEYDLMVPFTKDSWHGRMRACRGVGASLSEGEPERWDREHRKLLDEIAPEQFEVLHYAALAVLRKKEKG